MNLSERVLILGEGGFGSRMVKELKKINTDLNCSVIVGNDKERKNLENVENDLEDLLQIRGISGTGKNPKLAYKACARHKEEIEKLIGKYRYIFHINGFSGGSGAGTCQYILENFQHPFHLVSGPMPDFSESQKLLNNSLKAITWYEKFSKVYPLDNRKAKDSVFYKDFNDKFIKDLSFLFSFENKDWITRDMDFANTVDMLFPSGFRRKGIISIVKFEIENLEDNMSFEQLYETNKSVGFNFPKEAFGAAGVILKLAGNQLYNKEAQNYLNKFNEWLNEVMPLKQIHQGIYTEDSGVNEITLILSGPALTEEYLKDYIKENKILTSRFNETFQNAREESFIYDGEETMSFDSNEKTEDNSFIEDNDEDEDIMFLLDEEF